MGGNNVRLPPPVLTDHPVDVGLRSEAAILAELVRRGYRALVPFGSNQRYDVVIDLGGRFLRAQCKTGRFRNGVVLFNTRSVRCNTRGAIFRDYDGDADLFLVYCPENATVYCVPVEEAPRGYMYLRVEPTLNGQRDGVRWASEYELPA
jgi:hypothetical protein